MGLQDRDYYWKKRDEIEQKPQRSPAGRPPPKVFDPLKAQEHIQAPAMKRGPPELWGAGWHWTVKLMVWLAIACLTASLIRLLRGVL